MSTVYYLGAIIIAVVVFGVVIKDDGHRIDDDIWCQVVIPLALVFLWPLAIIAFIIWTLWRDGDA